MTGSPRHRIVAKEVTPMKISAVCSSAVLTASATDTLLEAAQKMTRHRVGALAVVDEGALVGILSEADLVAAIAEMAGFATTPIADYMTEGAITISPADDAGIAARRMVEHGIGHLPVMDGDTAIAMVSKGDLLAVGAVPTRR
jgi:CBS domain-containing protein